MAHKTHPYVQRLGILTNWRSRWFSAREYRHYLTEDVLLREMLHKNLRNVGVEHIELERAGNKFSVIIFTSRPGLLIGRAGAGVEDLRSIIVKTIRKIRVAKEEPARKFAVRAALSDDPQRKATKRLETLAHKPTPAFPEIRIEVREVRNPELYSSLVGANIAEQLERRIPFRRVVKRTLERIMMNKQVKGAKILLKGRLDGSEMARRESLKAGQLPLQTLRSDVDYAHVNAHTTYGVIGIKVWIYKGEKLD